MEQPALTDSIDQAICSFRGQFGGIEYGESTRWHVANLWLSIEKAVIAELRARSNYSDAANEF